MRSLLRTVFLLVEAARAAFHDDLGLSLDEVNVDQVKQAFRALALKIHPDKAHLADKAEAEKANANFAKLSDAYHALDTQEKCEAYVAAARPQQARQQKADDNDEADQYQQHSWYAALENLFAKRRSNPFEKNFLDMTYVDTVLNKMKGQLPQRQGQLPPRKEKEKIKKADDPFTTTHPFNGLPFGMHAELPSGVSMSSSTSNSHWSSSGVSSFSHTETTIGPDGKRVTKSISGDEGGNIETVHDTGGGGGPTVRRVRVSSPTNSAAQRAAQRLSDSPAGHGFLEPKRTKMRRIKVPG